MTIGWPRMGRMRSAMMRAATSVDPPGGNGTIRVIWRDGKVCACADAIPANTVSAMAMSFRIWSLPKFIGSIVRRVSRRRNPPPYEKNAGLRSRTSALQTLDWLAQQRDRPDRAVGDHGVDAEHRGDPLGRQHVTRR